jgi:hypothetical protein
MKSTGRSLTRASASSPSVGAEDAQLVQQHCAIEPVVVGD